MHGLLRVSTPKKGEEGYFDGVIAKDNGDGTYRVEFDDGDVEERAPRHDIRVISQGGAEANDPNLPQDEVHVLLYCQNPDTAVDREET